MWRCSNCSESIDSSFEVCWNCGTSSTGEPDQDFRRAEQISEQEVSELPEMELSSLKSMNQRGQSDASNLATRVIIKHCTICAVILTILAWIVSPWPWSSHYHRAESLRRNGFYRLAVSDYTRSIGLQEETNDFDYSSYFKRARLYEDLGEYQLAVDDLTVLLEQTYVYYPGQKVFCLNTRAKNLICLGRYKEAVYDLDLSLVLDPDNYRAKRLLEEAKSKLKHGSKQIQQANIDEI